MKINEMKTLTYDELRSIYKEHLSTLDISQSTRNTANVDAFYLWRKGSKELFWNIVFADDFECQAKETLLTTLTKHSKGNPSALLSGYFYHLKRFREFAFEGTGIVIQAKETIPQKVISKKVDAKVPTPCISEVERYLKQWDALENYHLQEDALNRLFFELCPTNSDITDVLLKCSTLNDFYSTNIFSIYPVAKHILSLGIDKRLHNGDETLVDDIQHITIGGKEKNFYSFASKYCSHHNPIDYPIYDSYVDEVLRYFQKVDAFASFKSSDLKNYKKFKTILDNFRSYYGLDKYTLKQIDQYIWQLGKEFFPKKYYK